MSASSALAAGNETFQPEPSWQVAFVRPVALQQYSGADTQLLNWPFLPPDPDIEGQHEFIKRYDAAGDVWGTCRCGLWYKKYAGPAQYAGGYPHPATVLDSQQPSWEDHIYSEPGGDTNPHLLALP